MQHSGMPALAMCLDAFGWLGIASVGAMLLLVNKATPIMRPPRHSS